MGDVDLQHIGNNHQFVDIFTKALGAEKLQQISMALGLRPLDISSLRGREEVKIRNLKVVESESRNESKAKSDGSVNRKLKAGKCRKSDKGPQEP